MEPMAGEVRFNGFFNGTPIDLSTIERHNDMEKAYTTAMGSKKLTMVSVGDLSGSKKSANILLEFIGQKIKAGRLTCLSFYGWNGAASEIREETLSQIADKAKGLQELYI